MALPWLCLVGAWSGARCQELNPSLYGNGYGSKTTGTVAFLQDLTVLSRLEGFSVALAASRPYFLDGVHSGTLMGTIDLSPGGIGISLGTNRYGGLSETRGSLGYARKLSEHISLGAGLRYQRLAARSYQPLSELGVEPALGLRLSQALRAGVGVVIPAQGTQPAAVRTGLGYEPGPGWSAYFEVLKIQGQDALFRLGFHYRPAERVLINGGFSTGRDSWWFGSGYRLGAFQVAFYSSFHPQLGVSPGLSIAWGKPVETKQP